MICKKCGKEFDGNFCPNCGWKVKEKEPRKKLTKKQIMAIVIPIVVVAVLIAIIVPSAVVSSNIFRVGKVDKINIGDTQEQVIKILGEPYEKSDYKFEYYSNDYLKLAKQIDDYYNSDLDIDEDFDLDKDIDDFDPDKDLNWDDEDKITKMEEQLETMLYKYIEVEFDSEGKVKSVFFDAEKCDSKEYKKVVKSYKITTNKVKQCVPTDICYSAKFTDKSFYKGLAIKDFVWIYSTDKGTVQWSDQWKSDYEAKIKIEKDPNIIYVDTCGADGKNAWYELRTNGELAILGSGEVRVRVNRKIKNSLFSGNHKVIIGENITSIPRYETKNESIFEEPEKITDVIFEKDSKITYLGACLFSECKNLTTIEIPSSVTVIDSDAFEGCSSLTSVTFGDNSQLTGIGYSVFDDCSSLTSIEIPISVTSMGSHVFDNCNSLTIYCEAESKPSGWNSDWNRGDRPVVWGHNNITTNADYDYVIRNGKVYLTKYKGNGGDVVIPNTIDGKEIIGIGGEIFSGNGTITRISIPSSVTSIVNSAFYGCRRLTSVTFGDNSQLTSISPGAFKDCSSLTSIEIPSSVTSIGNSAFYGCSRLTSVTFGDNSQLTSIGSGAFKECSSLTSIVIPSSVTSIGSSAFYSCSILTSVTFGNTNGWYYSLDSSTTSGTSINVTDPSLNAVNLESNYLYYWKRNA